MTDTTQITDQTGNPVQVSIMSDPQPLVDTPTQLQSEPQTISAVQDTLAILPTQTEVPVTRGDIAAIWLAIGVLKDRIGMS